MVREIFERVNEIWCFSINEEGSFYKAAYEEGLVAHGDIDRDFVETIMSYGPGDAFPIYNPTYPVSYNLIDGHTFTIGSGPENMSASWFALLEASQESCVCSVEDLI